MIQRLLEIEKKLNITITMPQICYFECGEPITKKYGKESDSLCFHSLDEDHDNWDPSNKVPAHMRCHNSNAMKGKGKTLSEETKARIRAQKRGSYKKFINFGGSRAVIIPDQWVKSLEKEHSKKMFGVILEVNNEQIEITPMWEDEVN